MKQIAILFFACSALALFAFDDTREIWDTGFRAKRPQGTPPTSPSRVDKSSPKAIDYRFAHADPAPSKGAVIPVLGVTVWNLHHPEASNATAPRLLVPDAVSSTPLEYVPERSRLDDRLHVGDRVRLSIECPREGWLYVIDRERFRDGTRGNPYLLFPLSRLNKGDNRVGPGRLIEIPGQQDRIPALRIERHDDRYIGEDLLIIFSPDRFAEISVTESSLPLPEELVSRWERDFTSAALRLDLINNGGVWTAAEKSAGGSQQRLLTPEDPMPQSIFAATGVQRGPLMVHIPLEVEP